VEICPVGARHFGDLNDPNSPVRKLLGSEFSFRLKDELNTSPQLYYSTSGKKWIPAECEADVSEKTTGG
jgi:molybdopterin-containing oxidoreductase family iron-sulfur binding subunit